MPFDRVLVTGGSGFIGSHVVEHLVGIGQPVRVLDIDTTLAESMFRDHDVEVIRGDACRPDNISQVLEGCDGVIHLAALLGVERTDRMPYETLEANLGASITLLKASKEAGIKRMVFGSSSEVYGEPERVPIREDDPKSPVSVYGLAKLASEAYFSAYHEKFGMANTVVRYCNVYGPRQRPEWVVPMFIDNVVRGRPPVIFGDGSQVRSFTFVKDAARATVLALEKDKVAGQIINIGSPVPVSIKDLAERVLELSGSKLGIEHRQFGDGIRPRERDVSRRIPDITRAKELLGWEPATGIDEGLVETIEWFRSSLQ